MERKSLGSITSVALWVIAIGILFLTRFFPCNKGHAYLAASRGRRLQSMANNSGPGIDPHRPGHYRVNAIGGAAYVILPVRKVAVGFKLLKEFSNSYTVQGYSLQITGAITF